MAKLDICEFNYITNGKRQNTFNFSYCYTDDGMIKDREALTKGMSCIYTTTFFGDVGMYESMSDKYGQNKASFYNIDNDHIVHNMYELTKTPLKTTLTRISKNGNIDIYVSPISSDFIHLVQFQNYAYGLTPMSYDAPTMINIVDAATTKYDSSYYYQLSASNNQTFCYFQPNDLSAGISTYEEWLPENIDDVDDLKSKMSAIFNVRQDLSGLMYNKLIEIPEDTIYNEYQKGYIQCDQILMKNHLDYTYTLSIGSDTYSSISGCREYCNIGVCGNQLYATYRNNISYQKKSSETIDGLVNRYSLSALQPKNSYTYQYIEVINSWNKYDASKVEGHKSSMFSISLIDTGLNESSINEDAKQKLRQNITNSIRTIVDAISPANTQLFNVYFEGK